MRFVIFIGSMVDRVVEVVTGKPEVAGYIKGRLKKRFGVKSTTAEDGDGSISFYLDIPGGLTRSDKVNTAKMFGLTLREVRFTNTKGSEWKITFLPKGIMGVKSLIRSFPNLIQQMHTSKNAQDFEPKEILYLTYEQKLELRKRQRQSSPVFEDIFDYLFGITILRYLFFYIYRRREFIDRIRKKIPREPYDLESVFITFAGIAVIVLFLYTFVFWVSLLCLLVIGYAVRRIRASLKIKMYR